MSTKSIKSDWVVPLEIPVSTIDPIDIGSTGAGLYYNSVKNLFRIGVLQGDSTIRWGSSGIVWDEVIETREK